MKNHFYVTTPIYYVNAKPHLGTLYSTIIADIAARYQKMKDKDVFFSTGTDEHGQKIADIAAQKGVKPAEFVDQMITPFTECWKRFGIEYSSFIRTTDTTHVERVQKVIKQLLDQGDIYKAAYEGLYCTPCESFVTLAEQSEAAECATHKVPLQKVSEESYFFRLSAYQDQLLQWYQEHPDFIIPSERSAEIVSFVTSGLKDLSISRTSVSWGIPFPGDEKHTIYVWVDALLNYLSVLGSEEEEWWPADLHVMAKDIVRFHAVYWPALLMALKKPLPRQLLVHGYLLLNDQKMSKSGAHQLDPLELADRFGVDRIRYYLMKQVAFGHDGSCSLHDLVTITNADLSNNLGNLAQRILTIARQKKITTIVGPEVWEAAAVKLRKVAEEAVRSYVEEMNHYQYHKALHAVMHLLAEANAYVHSQEPWKLKEVDTELLQEIIAATLHVLDTAAILLLPFIPESVDKLRTLLGRSVVEGNLLEHARTDSWESTFTPQVIEQPLFPRLEVPVVEGKKQEQKKEHSQAVEGLITIDVFASIKIAAGTIEEVQSVAKSEKLLQLTVNLGSFGIRTILSGVAQLCKPEDLKGKQGLCVINLPERKMAGIVSQGMMLFAKKEDGTLTLTTVDAHVANGTIIS